MILERNSRLVRWAYWFERVIGDRVPNKTGLCSFTWRICALTPMAILAAVVFSPIWGPAWCVIWILEHTSLGDKLDKRVSREGGILGERVHAWHDKVCPIIKLED